MDEPPEFVKYGTALPDFKGEDEKGERSLAVRTKWNEPHQFKHDVRREDMVVTDKQGRRRFHGAFTGGFSAGYYNTVGSEEGWTPKNMFERKGKQNVHDFMDDEDRDQFGISPKMLAAKEVYKPIEKPEVKQICGYSHNVVPKTDATMGLRIIRTMGYVENRGDTLAHFDKMMALNRKLHLAKSKNDVEQSLELLEEKLKIRGAVKDKTTNFELPKSNNLTFGMGYQRLDSLLTKNTRHEAVKSTKSKFSIQGGGFGVNCFEDDDEDIYAQDSMANYDIDLTINKARRRDSGEEKDYSLLALGFNDNVVFKRSKHCKKFERFQQRLPRPDLPRNWRPKIAVFQPKPNASEEATKKHQMRTIAQRSRALNTEQDRIDDRRRRVQNQQLEWEKQKDEENERKRVEDEKRKAEEKEKLLKSIFAGRFTQETGIVEVREVIKKVASIEITTWAPANTLCKRFNVPNPRVVESSENAPENDAAGFVKSVTGGDGQLTLKNSHYGSVLPSPEEMRTKEEQEKQKKAPTTNPDYVTDIFGASDEETEDLLEKRPDIDAFAAIFGESDNEPDDDVIEIKPTEPDNFAALLPDSLKNPDRYQPPTPPRQPSRIPTLTPEQTPIGVPSKYVVQEMLAKYRQQMKFGDVNDEKNWWKERPVQRKPLNIYRQDSDSDLEITEIKQGPGKSKIHPDAIKGYAPEKKEKKKKKDKKKKKKKKKSKTADSSDDWASA